MFERDLPGENKSGMSFQQPSQQLPLETCETMNDSWGFNISDRNYKTTRRLIQYLVGAAGRNANFLLNIGPMPNGKIQPEFTDTLNAIGQWLQQNGRSIYGTRGGPMAPQTWGVVTTKGKSVFVHLLKQPGTPYIVITGLKTKVLGGAMLNTNKPLRVTQQPEGVFVYTDGMEWNDTDTIVGIENGISSRPAESH